MSLEYYRNSRICIVGIGYIGSNLLEFFNFKKEEYNIDIIPINKYNTEILNNLEVDYLFFCAGTSGDFREKILETIDSNISLITLILSTITVNKCMTVLSSTRVYGFTSEITYFDEEYSINFSNKSIDYIYNGTKLLLESIVLNYNSNKISKMNCVRISNIVGKYKDRNEETLIKKIFNCKYNNILLKYNGCLKSSKDYLYIDDAIEGIIRANCIGENQNIYNIGLGESLSILEILSILGIKYYDNNNSKVENSYINIIKAKNKLMYNPTFKAKELIQKSYSEFEEINERN